MKITKFPLVAMFAHQETQRVRLLDALAKEASYRKEGRHRLTALNMLALWVVICQPGKTISEYVEERQLRGLSYHLPILRDRGYIVVVRRTGRRGRAEELHLSASGMKVLGELNASLSVCEPKADRFVKLA